MKRFGSLMLTCFIAVSSMPVLSFAESASFVRWEDTSEKLHRLSEMQGKPVLLHYWAAWCGPCRQVLPQLVSWSAAHPEYQVLMLSLDQRIGQADYFLQQMNMQISPLLANQSDARQLGVRGLPMTFLVDPYGQILSRFIGEMEWTPTTAEQFSVHLTQVANNPQ